MESKFTMPWCERCRILHVKDADLHVAGLRCSRTGLRELRGWGQRARWLGALGRLSLPLLH